MENPMSRTDDALSSICIIDTADPPAAVVAVPQVLRGQGPGHVPAIPLPLILLLSNLSIVIPEAMRRVYSLGSGFCRQSSEAPHGGFETIFLNQLALPALGYASGLFDGSQGSLSVRHPGVPGSSSFRSINHPHCFTPL